MGSGTRCVELKFFGRCFQKGCEQQRRLRQQQKEIGWLGLTRGGGKGMGESNEGSGSSIGVRGELTRGGGGSEGAVR